ncbi:MAG TPA: carboxypeptidase-like regulatory domain-containing protein [Polyangiaceae bacterium]
MVAALLSVTACGSNRFDGDAGASTDSGTVFDAPAFPDAGAEAGCGLTCEVVACDGGAHTTISGTVYDPGGNNPLYDALVYIPKFPNDPLPVIKHGPSCDVCAATISNVVAVTLSDANGKFTLTDVPVGQDIPLVVQIGKWRRAYTMPSPVVACQDNPFPNSATPSDRLRLPAKQSEGDMPRIALSTGCDPMNDLFAKVGIDPTEFTSSSGSGAVHVYQGKQSDFPLTGSTDAYAFWDDANAMSQYDILINSCECGPYPRGNTAHTNLDAYLNAGGRFFGSHYQINFFDGLLDEGATEPAAADMKNAANWASDWGIPGPGPWAIDTSFPKGKAMADWMHGVFPSDAYGSVPIDPATSIVEDIASTKPGLSQQWIYDSSDQIPAYISINTPTTADPDKRCGRAVLADLHVGSTSTLSLTEQEASLEFMFFDLAACVIDDAKPPPVPQPN